MIEKGNGEFKLNANSSYKSRKEIYENLEGFLSEKEIAPIRKKIKMYLDEYTNGVLFEKFKVSIDPYFTVRELILYIDEDNFEYRRILFNEEGDITSVMHFKGIDKNRYTHKCVYGLSRKSIDRLNHCI